MKNREFKLADCIGAGCGILLLVLAVCCIVFGGVGRRAGMPESKAPEGAVVSYGTAKGRNGLVEVKVVADENGIYQLQVTDNGETEGIGTPAMDRIPQAIFDNQSLGVEVLGGATISSEAVKKAAAAAMSNAGLSPWDFGGVRVLTNEVSEKVETGVKVTVLTASDWEEKYPDVYASYMQNGENDEITDYLADYPMLKTLYEGYGFAKSYGSARGHFYDVDDLYETGRPHPMANCFTCKTPDYTAMVNEQGSSAYTLAFEDVQQQVNEPISCYNCHANKVPELVVTHSYLTDAVGEDFENIDAATLACGQCHVEYYFAPTDKATTLPYTNLDSMNPDSMLEMYNNLMVDGEPFADWTNPRTGVRLIKAQHPELETFTGDGSQHRTDYTCADCHMGEFTGKDGKIYPNHNLTSPLDNTELIRGECSTCHEDLVSQVRELQSDVEARTDEVGNKLVDITERLAAEVEAGKMSEDKLNEIRALARDAQFYWDFVFVENSEGAHNSKLTYDCLDKAEALADKALALFA